MAGNFSHFLVMTFHKAASSRHGVLQQSRKAVLSNWLQHAGFGFATMARPLCPIHVALSTHSRSRQGRSQWKGPDIKAFAIYAHWLKRSKPMYTPSAHGDSIQSGNLAFLESFPNIPVPNNLLQQKQLLHLLRLLLRRITPIILPLHLHNHLLHLPRLPRPLLRTHLCLLLEELIVRLPITAAQSIPQRRELPVVVVEV